MSTLLPEGFCLQTPTWGDLQAVADLMAATEIAERGETDMEVEDLSVDWKRSGFDLARDAWIVRAPDGKVTGYEELYNGRDHAQLLGDGYVHPGYGGRGLGTTLLRRLEERARQHIPLAPPEGRVYIRNGISGADKAGLALHLAEGYTPVRYFWRMEIQMSAPPDAPAWPEGIAVRTMIPGEDDRRVYDALEDGFRGHWGDRKWDFENWKNRNLAGEAYDPSLWFIAGQGGEIAGCAHGRLRQAVGWVSQLAVRPPYRRKGLGRALLLACFGEFYRCGITRVGLGVDAENPTGATLLYTGVGMQTVHEYIACEKELRPAAAGATE